MRMHARDFVRASRGVHFTQTNFPGGGPVVYRKSNHFARAPREVHFTYTNVPGLRGDIYYTNFHPRFLGAYGEFEDQDKRIG